MDVGFLTHTSSNYSSCFFAVFVVEAPPFSLLREPLFYRIRVAIEYREFKTIVDIW